MEGLFAFTIVAAAVNVTISLPTELNAQNLWALTELFPLYNQTESPHRHRVIDGYWDQVLKGHVRVGF